MKIAVMDLYFDDLSAGEAVREAEACISSGEKCVVVTPNAEIALLCKKDPELKRIVNESRIVLPDGISVILASKIVGAGITRKTAGIDFAQELCKALAERNGRLYLLGAKPGVAEEAGKRLSEKYKGLVIAGTHDGYFAQDEEESVTDLVNASEPDAVFVCLGAPKQELFMDRNKDKLRAPVMAGLGGSLDIFAGNLKRAPKIFIKLGVEWLYRLISEPKRIKRMIKLPAYLWDALKWRIGGGKNA